MNLAFLLIVCVSLAAGVNGLCRKPASTRLKMCAAVFCLVSFIAVPFVPAVAKGSKAKLYDINLPPEHMAFFFNTNLQAAAECKKDRHCPHKIHLDKNACWGYEDGCTDNARYSLPKCPGEALGWVKTKAEQIALFFQEGDFGYIKERLKDMFVLCQPAHPDDSFVECSQYFRFCKARNILFDFTSLLTIPEPMRYREDIIREGQVGGHCRVKKEWLHSEGQHKSPLQSWYAEFEHFTEFPYRPIQDGKCDVVIDKLTFVMKLDATVNMYHHFCDFLNLYATLHINNVFHTDVNILIWDTYPYLSNFGVTWKAFTNNPIMDLSAFKGKKVCLKNAVFPLLPRMIFGMYYNMPLVLGCHGSGLFHAFSKHVLHRLEIKQDENVTGKIRITLLSRNTEYRRILNEDEIIQVLAQHPEYVVKKVAYGRQMPFIEQLKTSHNSDILIGMHGAGLTHMLFQPDWGVVFEAYHCEDNCYKDLARLRGLKYITFERRELIRPQDEGHHPTLGAHDKFTNYAFDVNEFVKLVHVAADHVRSYKNEVGKSHLNHDEM